MKLKELTKQPEITGASVSLSSHDLKWIKHVATYLHNGDQFIMPSTFKQWIMQYNGATVVVIKPAGKGNKATTNIKF